MTDHTKLLALASQAIPGVQWIVGHEGDVYHMTDNPLEAVYFDPRNDDSQALAVWCWLMKEHRATDDGGVLGVRLRDGLRKGYAWSTETEWRASVTEAALRVVE